MNAESPPGLRAFQASQSRYAAPSEFQRHVDLGDQREQGGEVYGRGEQVDEEADAYARERGESGPAALDDRAGDEVDHVRAGDHDESEFDQGDPDQGLRADHHRKVPPSTPKKLTAVVRRRAGLFLP